MIHAEFKPKNLTDLFHNQLNTLYGIEKERKVALGVMAKAATSPEIRKELETAANETATHMKRLDDVFAAIGARPEAKVGGSATALFSDCTDSAKIESDLGARDAAMIVMAQTVQHNEIVRYGTAHAWAQALKQDKAGQILKQTLDEETASNTRLAALARTAIASAAPHAQA